MAPLETDPLLPQGRSAPEISGYGFRNPSNFNDYPPQSEVIEEAGDIEVKDDAQALRDGGGFSPLRVLVVLFAIVVGLAMIITLLSPGTADRPQSAPQDDAPTIQARVNRILTENPLIDGHNDLAILIRFLYQNDIYDKNFTEKFEHGGLYGHVDLPRLKEGKVGGAFWSAFTPCPENGTDFSDANYVDAVSMTLSQLDLLRRLTASYPTAFSIPTLNSSSALMSFEKDHRLISPLGIEGLHQIGNSFSNLRLFHSLGVKYATLTHNCDNAFADAALTTNSEGQTVAGPAYWGGLSEMGSSVVQEMNRMGMIVDLAHVSTDTMLDVLGARPNKTNGSEAPIIFSHSSAYALCPHPRNVPDDVLQLVKKTNSVVMVNFAPDFISCTPSGSKTGIPDPYPANATLHQVARHIIYIGELIGYDHVGLGSDFDGIPTTPRGLDDVSKYPELIAELLKMGVSDASASKVVGLNVLRVWADVERTASKLQKAGIRPVQDRIAKLYFTPNVVRAAH